MRVPGTTVDYPIVQGRQESPDFYLTHDVGGERSAWGAPYIDAGCAQAWAFVTCSYQTSNSRTVVYAKEVEGWDSRPSE